MRPSFRNRPKPISELAVYEATAALMATPANGISTTIENNWNVHFAIQIQRTSWMDRLNVRQVVIGKSLRIIARKAGDSSRFH